VRSTRDMMKFSVMFRESVGIGDKDWHQIENDAELQRRFILRINSRIKSSIIRKLGIMLGLIREIWSPNVCLKLVFNVVEK